MAPRAPKRSPLAVQLLVMLAEETMHPYRMLQLIKERRKDRIVNIAQRNSVYQTLDRLVRDGLAEVHDTQRADGRPERTVYRITADGMATAHQWLRAMLAAPAREYPEFPVALASLPFLDPAEAAELLQRRLEALEALLAEIDAEAVEAEHIGLPRLFLLEEEHQRAVTAAEADWLRDVLAQLRTGAITWDRDWLDGTARRLGPGPE